MIGEYRREIQMAQEHLAIHQICEKVGYWFTDAAVLSGAVSAAGYALDYEAFNAREWRPHRWPHINPTQDVAAAVQEISADLVAYDQAAAERGQTGAKVQAANVAARKRKAEYEKAAGLPAGDDA
jgi:capsid protein